MGLFNGVGTLKCRKCGKDVASGKIEATESGKDSRKRLILSGALKGTIIKGKSQNPENWSFLCSACQRSNATGHK